MRACSISNLKRTRFYFDVIKTLFSEMETAVLSGPCRPVGSTGGGVAHVCRNSSDTLKQLVGYRWQLLCSNAKRWPGDADRSDGKPLSIQKRDSDAAKAFFKFLIIHRITAAARLFHFGAQSLGIGNGAVRKALEASAPNHIGSAIFR